MINQKRKAHQPSFFDLLNIELVYCYTFNF